MVWLSLLLIATQASCWVLAVMGPNTCSRQESFTVTMRVLEKKPITTKTYTWCLKMPPRCTKYKQEIVDHYKIQTEPRTRWVSECCTGYQPDEVGVYCVPTCPLGCEHGNCTAPHICSCHPGYTGPDCNKKCPEGRWGLDCQQLCSCLQIVSCHHETGKCSCPPGYTGTRCESTCTTGMYGERCENRCSCKDSTSCHHVSGICDAVSTCNGSATCQTEWTPSKPEMIQRLIDNAETSHDSPVSEPLVTTSDTINSSSDTRNEQLTHNHTEEPENMRNDDSVSPPVIHDITLIPVEMLNIPTPRPSTDALTPLYTSTDRHLGEKNDSELEIAERRFLDEQSHEDQLEHSGNVQPTEHSTEDKQTTQMFEDSTETSSKLALRSTIFSEEISREQMPDDTRQDLLGQNSEVNTQGPYQQNDKGLEIDSIEKTSTNKTDGQRKKSTDHKKIKSKERLKDVPFQKSDFPSQTPTDFDQGWTASEFGDEESPKHHQQVQDTSHRDNMEKVVEFEKPKRMSDQKKVKDMADVGQLKITANKEQQLEDGKHSYSEFLSSFSIAAGVSTGIIMVAGLITLMARCRRSKPHQEIPQEVEMDAMPIKQEDNRTSIIAEEPMLPVVRPLFFSPVYLPGDVSPTEGNGLILTAVFSRPATTIHDLYRQQDLLRETLAPHYDVPPPTGTRNSMCTSISTAEPEHVYEELPYWRNLGSSSRSESQC